MSGALIETCFSGLTPRQKERFETLAPLYAEWNARINVISRKDMEHFAVHHVLHSLAIARACTFDAGARVLDVGCGGGFPGIPLAILFPEARFTLCDSIAKKIKVVTEVARALGLDNVEAVNARAETLPGRYDYVVSRAVTRMKEFAGWTWPLIERGRAGSLDNGILYLKGGDLAEELAEAGKPYELYPIRTWFDDDFFETKYVVYLPKR